MKKTVGFVLLFLWALAGFGQNGYGFFMKAADGTQWESIKTKTKSDGSLRIKTHHRAFDKFLKYIKVYRFEKAFPNVQTASLNHVLRVVLADSAAVNAFLQRPEISTIVGYDPNLKGEYPNDFYDSIGRPNTALQLIKAPQAWTITHGDSAVVVGVCDRRYEDSHEDLKGKIKKKLRLGKPSHSHHGTGVAGILAANTDNGKGIASIGYNTKLVVAAGSYRLIDGLDSLSKIPGMKVINCSWGICARSGPRREKLDSVIQEVRKRGVLVVASAGNGYIQPCRLNDDDRFDGYRYPGSYDLDNVLSVTSVGHKFPVGNKDSIYGRTAWRDCHQNTPRLGTNDPKTTHTHNRKVDICAPGWHVKDLREGNTYGVISGTSIATPFVTGTAALMFAVNHELTAAEAKDIIKSTADDIYHIKYNHQFKGQLGAGRINAYKAVLIAKLLKNPQNN